MYYSSAAHDRPFYAPPSENIRHFISFLSIKLIDTFLNKGKNKGTFSALQRALKRREWLYRVIHYTAIRAYAISKDRNPGSMSRKKFSLARPLIHAPRVYEAILNRRGTRAPFSFLSNKFPASFFVATSLSTRRTKETLFIFRSLRIIHTLYAKRRRGLH